MKHREIVKPLRKLERSARAGWVCVLLAVSACTPLLGPKEEQDRGPDRPVDMTSVPDAEPRVEVRTAAGNKNPYTVLGKTYHLLEDEAGYKEQGFASWYGQKFHGRNTSNGEVYDMYAMTAAHKTLPIPSYVRVTNLENGKQIIVRVNDRGPFHPGRIIDLSYAGAQRLGFADRGVAKVEVEIIVPGDQPPAPLRAENNKADVSDADTSGSDTLAVNSDSLSVSEAFLQVGAFGTRSAAEAHAERMNGVTSLPVVIHSREETPVMYRVRIGPLYQDEQVQTLREQLRKNDIQQTHIVYE